MAASADWLAVQERLKKGDRLALLELNRLITGVLAQLRAYDFREEWDDLRQEVAMAVIQNARRDRLRDPRAFVGYVRIIARNKLMDRIKQQMRRREHEVLAWDEESARSLAESTAAAFSDPADDPWALVAELPEPGRSLVIGIYREGRTYEEMAEHSGIPLGTLKRRLRQALEALRGRLRSDACGGGD